MRWQTTPFGVPLFMDRSVAWNRLLHPYIILI